jgi:hypothetical protein
LIFQLPSFILVGPNIFLNTFLSNTESFWIIFSLRTHVARYYYDDQIKEDYIGEVSSTQVEDVKWMYYIPTI